MAVSKRKINKSCHFERSGKSGLAEVYGLLAPFRVTN